jgi:fructose-1,6-bisphosphatase/inositol monophosphatase family enzyme
MNDAVFQRRLNAFKDEGEWLSFNLALVAEALDTIQDLSDQNIGGETVEQRIGEYKSWDPEIFRVDKDTEDDYTARLTQTGKKYVLLSEEAGRVEVNADAAGDPLYVVCDPFDGSYLFKRGIPDFWYSSFAFFDSNFDGKCCVVGDAIQKELAFADERSAYVAKLEGDGIVHKFKLGKEYREMMGRKDVTELKDASIESYAMKPTKYLLPLIEKYGDVFAPFKFFLPNGGPYAFADVAAGKIDCYFSFKQPFVDVFSGIQIAEKGEAIVTDFDGNPVRCSDNVKSVWDVLVTTNETLHNKILEQIAKCKARM